jgi:hypothetical protein
VQQDGAGGHCSHNDEYLNDMIEELGLTGKVQFYTQPANPPDLNILDLGLFNTLQTSYYEFAPKNSVEYIKCVYPHEMINRIFITIQTVYNQVIEDHGSNNYNIPQLNRNLLEKED